VDSTSVTCLKFVFPVLVWVSLNSCLLIMIWFVCQCFKFAFGASLIVVPWQRSAIKSLQGYVKYKRVYPFFRLCWWSYCLVQTGNMELYSLFPTDMNSSCVMCKSGEMILASLWPLVYMSFFLNKPKESILSYSSGILWSFSCDMKEQFVAKLYSTMTTST
jgi:hypothetical protein